MSASPRIRYRDLQRRHRVVCAERRPYINPIHHESKDRHKHRNDRWRRIIKSPRFIFCTTLVCIAELEPVTRKSKKYKNGRYVAKLSNTNIFCVKYATTSAKQNIPTQ